MLRTLIPEANEVYEMEGDAARAPARAPGRGAPGLAAKAVVPVADEGGWVVAEDAGWDAEVEGDAGDIGPAGGVAVAVAVVAAVVAEGTQDTGIALGPSVLPDNRRMGIVIEVGTGSREGTDAGTGTSGLAGWAAQCGVVGNWTMARTSMVKPGWPWEAPGWAVGTLLPWDGRGPRDGAGVPRNAGSRPCFCAGRVFL